MITYIDNGSYNDYHKYMEQYQMTDDERKRAMREYLNTRGMTITVKLMTQLSVAQMTFLVSMMPRA